jgi:cytochrome c553
MGRAPQPLETVSPWPKIGWRLTAIVLVAFFVLGFFVMGREQQNGPSLGMWAALCRGLGITADTAAAREWRPPLQLATRIAWTRPTLEQVAHGKIEHGAFVAQVCAACHGTRGVSASDQYPTLAGMPAVTIFKQLDDFRAGKRPSGVMNAIATALTVQDSADVAAYFASRTNGLPPALGEPLQGGHTLREDDPAIRLVFAGDPERGIPPCTACHGPSAIKLGAPSLMHQRPAYIERELAAFAEGTRQNDINEQMRTIASQLKPAEMHAIAQLYGAGSGPAAQAAPR